MLHWNLMRRFWDREESLSIFLWLLLVFVFVVGPMSHLGPGLILLVDFFLGVVLVSGIWATIQHPKIALLAIIFVCLSVASTAFKALSDSSILARFVSAFFDLPALLLFVFIVMKQTVKSGPVTAHRVKGAIASYLLLGILWAKLYYLVALAVPNAFQGVDSSNHFTAYLYFSFVTLTTLGYGDVLPLHVIPRTLANAEALLGQLFPAVFIARIVSLEIESRRQN